MDRMAMAISAMDFDEHDADGSLERQRAGRKSTLMSVAVNVLLTCAQIAAGLFAGSQALIADGIHSLSDLVSDFVVLFATHHSRKEADADHAYGHHRYENAASLALGGLLIAVGAGMLWSAFQKIQTPHAVPAVHMLALWEALGALAAKELLFRYMLAVAEKLRSSLLVANAWHARSDAASSLVVVIGDVHLEVDAQQTVAEGHDIAVEARRRVIERHEVLDVMTHVDPVATPSSLPPVTDRTAVSLPEG